jgi:DNA invertase Pin-like site-specific DNA recombinase
MAKRAKTMIKAVAYLRTSSAANCGEDKDSDKRQMAAIESYARRAAYEIVLPPYYDEAVSGADPFETRPGFSSMLAFLIEHPECRTILVENASRFVRGLMLQELGYAMLKDMGITLIPVDAPGHFAKDTDPMIDAMRQMVGIMNELQRKILVNQLRVARLRKRQESGKCEGRKSHRELHSGAVELARRLRHRNPHTHEQRSYRDIAAQLAQQGHLARSGKPFSPSAIRSMLEGPAKRTA